jgi:leucyl aminopeptidase (aminopeptidase T)
MTINKGNKTMMSYTTQDLRDFAKRLNEVADTLDAQSLVHITGGTEVTVMLRYL